MQIKNKIARNIIANYIGVIGHIVIAFLLSPFLVHTLGDSRYGIWTVASAFSGYMSLLDLGISAALTRYVARHYAKGDFHTVNRYINSSLLLFLIIAILIISFSALLSGALAETMQVDRSLKGILELLIIIISVDVSLFVITGVYRGAFGGFQRFEIINIATLGGAIFKAIAFYLLLSQGHGLISMGYIAVLANVFIALFYIVVLKRTYKFTSFNFRHIHTEQLFKVFHFSKYVFVAMIANQILNYSSPFIIGIFLSASAVTYYSIPWTLSEHIKQLCFAVSRVYIPAFSEIDSKQDMAILYRTYLDGTRVMLVVSNLFCVGMLTLGADFIGVWIGEKYEIESKPLVLILFVTFYFYAPQLIGLALLQGMGIVKRYAQASVITAIISLLLSIGLVEKYGLIGVALGSSIPQAVLAGLIIPLYISSRVFQKSILEYWAHTHLRAIIPGICLYSLLETARSTWAPDSYFVILSEALTCSLVYFLLIFFFTLKPDERNRVTSFLFNRLPSAGKS